MHESFDTESGTRMIFLGEAALVDGFQLIGFETHADPDADEIDRILHDLEESGEKAFVVIGVSCSEQGSPAYRRLRSEGGRVVIAKVPPLADPSCFQCDVDQRVRTLLGGDKEL